VETLIKYWQRFVSPLYAWAIHCKYEPSCSQFAIDAIRKYGTVKGCCKAGWRICKCNPLSKGGNDPA